MQALLLLSHNRVEINVGTATALPMQALLDNRVEINVGTATALP